MMHASGCHEHGNLVRDLALGRLGDSEAERAETILSSCASCKAWWSQNVENERAMAVDTAVREGLARFKAPSRRRQRQWWAAAAAVILAVATGMFWHLGSGPVGVETQALYDTPKPVLQPEVSTISVMDFEAAVTKSEMEIVGHLAADETAEARQATGPRQATEAIFAGDFESGSLDGWTPST
jgi:hypothetical protein